jgi:hypothetical protein
MVRLKPDTTGTTVRQADDASPVVSAFRRTVIAGPGPNKVGLYTSP